MRGVGRGGAGLAMLALAGCAQIGEPPGGPPDRTPPAMIGTVPDSLGIYPRFDGDAAFVFNEVVAEGTSPNFGFGNGDLEKLVVLSPSENVPHVHWKRSRITVKPKEGWQPDRVYRIELLPGIADLRNNRSRFGRVITFSTGAPLPTRYLTGRAVDWGTSRPAPGALIEAALLPDSLVYRTAADSSGRFNFGPLPQGAYLVAAVLDQNRNRKLDPRETFDSVRLSAGRDSAGELWMFRHDTVAARLQSVVKNDSLSLLLTFNQQLNPYQRLPADSVRVRLLPDSSAVGVVAVLPKEAYDSLFAPAPKQDTTTADSAQAARRAAQDSARRADSVRAAAERARAARGRQAPADTVDRGPLKTKPPLYDKLYVRLEQPLVAGAKYVVEVHGLESVSRVAGEARQGFQVPEPPKAPPDSGKAKPDSAKAKPDSAAARPDTGGRRPPPPSPGRAVRRPRP